MKVSTALITLAVAAAVPAGIALAAPAPAVAVAQYTFDAGVSTTGYISEQSGRGLPLRVRSADGGVVRFVTRGTGRAVTFPARCAAGAVRCPRIVLEGGDDPDLDPGTRTFRYGGWIRTTMAQAGPSGNVMQKGVATVESQWKLQVGGPNGRAMCVLVGRGSTQKFVAKSSVAVTNNAWHHISCRRTATALTIFVDQVARGAVAIPPGLAIANAMPLRIGGQNLSDRTENYGGALDDAFFVLT